MGAFHHHVSQLSTLGCVRGPALPDWLATSDRAGGLAVRGPLWHRGKQARTRLAVLLFSWTQLVEDLATRGACATSHRPHPSDAPLHGSGGWRSRIDGRARSFFEG